MQGRMVDLQRYRPTSGEKLHRTNQGSKFLGGSFSNRDNVRAPMKFIREGQTWVKTRSKVKTTTLDH